MYSCARSATQSRSSKNWGAGTCFTLCDFVHERLELPAYIVDHCRGIGERLVRRGDIRLKLLCRQGATSTDILFWIFRHAMRPSNNQDSKLDARELTMEMCSCLETEVGRTARLALQRHNHDSEE